MLFYWLRAEYAAPSMKQGMPTRCADFARLSKSILANICRPYLCMLRATAHMCNSASLRIRTGATTKR